MKLKSTLKQSNFLQQQHKHQSSANLGGPDSRKSSRNFNNEATVNLPTHHLVAATHSLSPQSPCYQQQSMASIAAISALKPPTRKQLPTVKPTFIDLVKPIKFASMRNLSCSSGTGGGKLQRRQSQDDVQMARQLKILAIGDQSTVRRNKFAEDQ